jgi:hypothetical protein
MPFDPDKYLQEKAPAAAQGFDPDRYLSEKSAPKQELTLAKAAFPGANQSYAPRQVAVPSFGGMQIPGQQIPRRTVSEQEQQAMAGALDALSLPTRAAGTAAASMGYEGASGGKQGLEALADPETGLARPVRQALGNRMSQQIAGLRDKDRSLLGKAGNVAGLGIDAAGYALASAAEDPVAAAGAAIKPIASMVKGAKTWTSGKVATGADKAAERLIRRDYLPLKTHEKGGWSHEAAIKHGMYGKSNDELAKIGNAKLSELYKQQKDLIQTGKTLGGKVDFQQAIDDVMAKIEKGKDSELWDNAPRFVDEYKRRISRIRSVDPNDPQAAKAMREAMVKDVADAQLFKSDLGEDAAFASMKGVPGIDKDAAVRGRFAALLYGNIKDQIEKNVPAGLKEINKAMSEIIPLRNAADYRSAVQGRARIGSLTDFVLGGGAVIEPTVGLPVMVLKKIVDSPRFSTGAAVKIKQAAERMATAKSPSAAAFYADKLKTLGVTAAEIRALSTPTATQNAKD